MSYINKTIDETILIKIDNQSNKIEAIKSDMSGMKADIESVKTDIKIFKEENKNPHPQDLMKKQKFQNQRSHNI